MAQVFLGVGSNEGDRAAQISLAAQRLSRIPGTRLIQMAPLYETQPVGGPPQPDYLNTVIEAETSLEPGALLAALRALERELGRVPSSVRWGPRPIDLDILLYDDLVMSTPALTIPHPRLHERRFVLEPLAQLAPDVRHPVAGRRIIELLAGLSAAEPA
ncbi:MAG: 2-amino-4-hydroxy-6-hydroxymethyldihydropteridine diphosphokinase [Candidatus Omnitrophica bacterium]|nr:2-amino-4-hydroxy-6-hydroxymethyldihydropteridine diphosphokinase [Candidatus Omnitrophota bacterium]